MIRKYSILWFLLLVLCSACKSSLISNSDELLTDRERKELENYKKEVEIGRDMAGRLLQFYGTMSDQKLIRYVNELGTYLAQFTDANDRRYMFSILDTNAVHTFACPGGYILLTYGLIMNLKNEAELAMVLSHEIAHIERQHLYTTLQRFDKNKLKTTNNIDSILEARQRHAGTFNHEKGEDISKYLSGSAGPGVGLAQASKVGLSILMEVGLDRNLEFEADEYGLQIAVRANYDPYAMQNFLTRLDKNTPNLDIKMLESTHPKLIDRMSALTLQLQKIHAQEIVAANGEARFLKFARKP